MKKEEKNWNCCSLLWLVTSTSFIVVADMDLVISLRYGWPCLPLLSSTLSLSRNFNTVSFPYYSRHQLYWLPTSISSIIIVIHFESPLKSSGQSLQPSRSPSLMKERRWARFRALSSCKSPLLILCKIGFSISC